MRAKFTYQYCILCLRQIPVHRSYNRNWLKIEEWVRSLHIWKEYVMPSDKTKPLVFSIKQTVIKNLDGVPKQKAWLVQLSPVLSLKRSISHNFPQNHRVQSRNLVSSLPTASWVAPWEFSVKSKLDFVMSSIDMTKTMFLWRWIQSIIHYAIHEKGNS